MAEIETVAQAMYEAIVWDRPHAKWAELPEYWKKQFRVQAEAAMKAINDGGLF